MTRRPTILIADDEPFSRQVMARLCAGSHNADVLEAKDGFEACDLILSHRPDIALCDVVMPGLSGFEVARLSNALSPKTFVVALTGYDTPRMRQQTLEAGFDHYLSKPLQHNAFAGRIATLLELAHDKRQRHHTARTPIKTHNLFQAELLPFTTEARVSDAHDAVVLTEWLNRHYGPLCLDRPFELALEFLETLGLFAQECTETVALTLEYGKEGVLYLTVRTHRWMMPVIKSYFKNPDFPHFARLTNSRLSLHLPALISPSQAKQTGQATDFSSLAETYDRTLQAVRLRSPDLNGHLARLFDLCAKNRASFRSGSGIGSILAYLSFLLKQQEKKLAGLERQPHILDAVEQLVKALAHLRENEQALSKTAHEKILAAAVDLERALSALL